MDEVCVSQAPVLISDGIRCFTRLDRPPNSSTPQSSSSNAMPCTRDPRSDEAPRPRSVIEGELRIPAQVAQALAGPRLGREHSACVETRRFQDELTACLLDHPKAVHSQRRVPTS